MAESGYAARLEKFKNYFSQQNDYRIFVGVPLAAPRGWEQIQQMEKETLVGPDLRYHPIKDVRTWLVAYAGTGEYVDGEYLLPTLPQGVVSIMKNNYLSPPDFTKGDLVRGRSVVRIQFAKSPTHPTNARYFSTSITNISTEKLSCIAFGGYVDSPRGFILSTITADLFSAGQFEEWYGVKRGGWIEPGETVCDPSNYGSRCVWVYHFKNSSGALFHAGEMPLQRGFGQTIRRWLIGQ